jgi:hypothetical protein
MDRWCAWSDGAWARASARLLILIHHIVFDVVSFRI